MDYLERLSGYIPGIFQEVSYKTPEEILQSLRDASVSLLAIVEKHEDINLFGIYGDYETAKRAKRVSFSESDCFFEDNLPFFNLLPYFERNLCHLPISRGKLENDAYILYWRLFVCMTDKVTTVYIPKKYFIYSDKLTAEYNGRCVDLKPR